MSVRVQKMSAVNLGPIRKINLEFSDVNLVYGLNESGKTYLVEFLLRSLFKESKLFDIRKLQFNGQLEVTGLNKTPVVFSPDPKSKKLEDYLLNTITELPKDLCKLLVVRAGELSFENSPEGISETILKKYLSNESVLEQIGSKISSTIQSSNFGDGEISGSRRGENKKRLDKEYELRKTRELLEEIDQSYSEGQIQILNNKFEVISQLYQQKHETRCKLAYQLNNEVKQVTSKNNDLYTNLTKKVSSLRSLVNSLEKEIQDVTRKQNIILGHIKNEINFFDKKIKDEKEIIEKIAFASNEKSNFFNQQLEKFDPTSIEEISFQIKNYDEINNLIDSSKLRLLGFEEKLQPFEWLNNSIDTYQQCLGNKSEKELSNKLWNSWPLTIIAIVMILLIIIFSFLSQNINNIRITVIVSTLLIGTLMLINTLKDKKTKEKLNEQIQSSANLKEIDSIKQRFAEIFMDSANQIDLPKMRMVRDELRGIEINYENIKENLGNKLKELDEVKINIESEFYKFNNQIPLIFNWKSELDSLRRKANEFRTEYLQYTTFHEQISKNFSQMPSSEFQEFSLDEMLTVFELSEKRINEYQSKLNDRKTFINRNTQDLDKLPFIESSAIDSLEEWQNKFDSYGQLKQELERKISIIESFIVEYQESTATEEELSLTSENIDFEEVRMEIKTIKNNIRENENQKTDILLRLREMGVLEKDFIIPLVDEKLDFNLEEFKELENQKQKIVEDIELEKRQLENIKMKLIGAVDGRLSDTIDELIEKLKLDEHKFKEELDKLSSGMIAGIFVADVLKGLAGDERENIKITLNSQDVLRPLQKLTGRYKKYVLEDNGLSVKDDNYTFQLKDISTGTREQILLSLRLGFAANMMKSDQLFLILDDAFQHSDWIRRKYLIKHMFDLATEGWQIIYFTMDNHIKSLFDEFSVDFSGNYLSTNLEKIGN